MAGLSALNRMRVLFDTDQFTRIHKPALNAYSQFGMAR
jgi:hypothetical protein